MQNQTIIEVNNVLTKMVQKRREVVLSGSGIKEHKTNYDGLLTPLIYQVPDGTTYYGIVLPQSFPTMTEPDILTILKWYVRDGSVVTPGHHLLEVHSNFGDIIIPLLFTQHKAYRVVQTVKAHSEQVQMGDLLIVLQAITSQPHRRKNAKRKAA